MWVSNIPFLLGKNVSLYFSVSQTKQKCSPLCSSFYSQCVALESEKCELQLALTCSDVHCGCL